MDSALLTVLTISAIGMSLLFLSLVLFYGIISVLTAATRDRSLALPGQPEGHEADREAPADQALRAAVIAIALARAEAGREVGQARRAISQDSGNRDLSPWWSLHHQHRLAEKGKPRRS